MEVDFEHGPLTSEIVLTYLEADVGRISEEKDHRFSLRLLVHDFDSHLTTYLHLSLTILYFASLASLNDLIPCPNGE